VATATVVSERTQDREPGPASGRRRAVAQRARAELLSGLVALAVVFAGVAALFEWVFPDVVDPNYCLRLRQLRRTEAAARGPRRLVVALGSSLTYQGLDAAALDRPLSEAMGEPVTVLNMALPNHLFATQLLTWRRLQRDGVRPDVLLVEVLPALLIDESLHVNELRLPANRLCWADMKVIRPYRGDTRPHLKREVGLAVAGSLYTRRYAVAQALAPDLVPSVDDNNGQLVWMLKGRPPTLPAEVRARLLETARANCTYLLREFRPGRFATVRELLASARTAGVPTALVIMPDGPALHTWYPPGVLDRVETCVNTLAIEYGAEIINARDWFDDEEDFYDSHHMQSPAADRFTERIGREHILPLLRRQCHQWPGTQYEDLHASATDVPETSLAVPSGNVTGANQALGVCGGQRADQALLQRDEEPLVGLQPRR
jgi:hypothetical protein